MKSQLRVNLTLYYYVVFQQECDKHIIKEKKSGSGQ